MRRGTWGEAAELLTVPPPPTQDQIDTWIRESALWPLPVFATAEQFLVIVAQQRCRALSLRVDPRLPVSICGVWATGPAHDTIIVSAGLTGFRRDLVVLHEAMHVLLGHAGAWAAGPRPRRRFVPEEEWQAEWLATFLLARTRGLHRSAWIGHESTRSAARLLSGDG